MNIEDQNTIEIDVRQSYISTGFPPIDNTKNSQMGNNGPDMPKIA